MSNNVEKLLNLSVLRAELAGDDEWAGSLCGAGFFAAARFFLRACPRAAPENFADAVLRKAVALREGFAGFPGARAGADLGVALKVARSRAVAPAPAGFFAVSGRDVKQLAAGVILHGAQQTPRQYVRGIPISHVYDLPFTRVPIRTAPAPLEKYGAGADNKRHEPVVQKGTKSPAGFTLRGSTELARARTAEQGARRYGNVILPAAGIPAARPSVARLIQAAATS